MLPYLQQRATGVPIGFKAITCNAPSSLFFHQGIYEENISNGLYEKSLDYDVIQCF